jgi:transposase
MSSACSRPAWTHSDAHRSHLDLRYPGVCLEVRCDGVPVGAPWRDVPDCYGSWRAVYALFRRWQRARAWAQIVTALQTRADAAGLITWDVSVDSTIARAHQHAAGARRHPSQQQEPPGGLSIEPDALGRSRGGLTTKIHLACEQGPEGAVPDPDRRAAR